MTGVPLCVMAQYNGVFMRQRVGGLSLLVASLCLVGARSASAQPTAAVNYDFVYHEFEETSALGVHGDVAGPVGPFVLVGELGANRFDGATVASFAGGVRYPFAQSSSSSIQFAAQALLGLWHCGACEFNEKFIQPGVLVDIPRSDAFSIRVQFDVRRIFFEFGGEWAERVSAGAVWAF